MKATRPSTSLEQAALPVGFRLFSSGNGANSTTTSKVQLLKTLPIVVFIAHSTRLNRYTHRFIWREKC